MRYYIEIDARDIGRFRIDKPCQGSHGNCVLVLKDKNNMTVGFELLTVGFELLLQRPRVEWIPCSERLPEDDKDVLMCYTQGKMEVGYYHVDHTYYPTEYADLNETGWFNENDDVVDDPIAWLPLPEPYKKEGDPK